MAESLTAKERSLADVQAAARSAGLDSSRAKAQVLQFSDKLNTEDIKLLEIPKELLSSLKEGQRVVIRGEPHEDAVLCTDDATFDLRLVDTSNSLLLCPSLEFTNECDEAVSEPIAKKEVTACLFTTYEVRKGRPRLEKLRRLLEEHPFKGEEFEVEYNDTEEESGMVTGGKNTAIKKYHFSDLLDLVQASEQELVDGLKKIEACNINGYWRVFDPDYMEAMFQHVLTVLDEEYWHWSQIPLKKCCLKLEELAPNYVFEHCLSCYGNSFMKDDEEFYQLLENRVCQFYAVLLLRPAGRFNYHEFMEAWEQSVPVGMTTSLDQLKGLALTDLAAVPPVIWHYPASDLPQEPVARFNKLFSVKQKWSYDNIHPYIKDLETPTQSLNALLLKYTRTSTGKGGVAKMYGPKSTAL